MVSIIHSELVEVVSSLKTDGVGIAEQNARVVVLHRMQ